LRPSLEQLSVNRNDSQGNAQAHQSAAQARGRRLSLSRSASDLFDRTGFAREKDSPRTMRLNV
jgi:hypothetical protein